MWKEVIQASSQDGKRLNVLTWISRCTLDVIGEGTICSLFFRKCGHELNHPIFLVAFDVDCGALDDNLNPMMQAYRNML